MSKRKSGLRNPFEGIEELDFSTFVAPYLEFADSYRENIYAVKKKKLGNAYLVTYVDEPDLFRIVFAKNKDKAKGDVTKYLKENLHPNFINRQWRDKYNKCRAIQVPEFNKYAQTKKIPVDVLMKVLKVNVTCASCGKGTFTYEDLSNKSCFKLEGLGDLNDFTEGLVICRNCYEKMLTQ